MAQRSVTEELGTLGALLRAPFEAMLAHNYAKLAEEGFDDLRPAHGAVLRHMTEEGCRVTELADKAGMTKQSMAELVEYLRERGYVRVSSDRTDRRAKVVMLTRRGWQVHSALVRISRGFEKECARALGDVQWTQFRRGLEELAAWSARYAEQPPGLLPIKTT
jgi:DNA-binding MarR family transcriptional regulator